MKTPKDDLRYDPNEGYPRRPFPDPSTRTVKGPKIHQILSLLRASGVPDMLRDMMKTRPGPPGYPVELVLLGLCLSAYYDGSGLIADGWRILTYGTEPTVRAELGIPHADIEDPDACYNLSHRVYTAWAALTDVLDPAPHDRHSRPTLEEEESLFRAWEDPANEDVVRRLDEIANRIVLTPVAMAFAKGIMKHWPGHLAVDGTSLPTFGEPATSTRGSYEVSAGFHHKGGENGTLEFAYTLHLLVTGHANPNDAGRYPQLCAGLAVDTPNKRTGANCTRLCTAFGRMTPLRGYFAGDRAYTIALPENWTVPLRKAGWIPVFDFTKNQVNATGYHHGAITRAGRLFCPKTPPELFSVYVELASADSGPEYDALQPALDAIEPYALLRKSTPDGDGYERYACPSPPLNCAWAAARPDDVAAERHRTGKRPLKRQGKKPPPPPPFVDLDNLRQRLSHPAARPTVDAGSTPFAHRPLVCRQTSVTVPPDVMARERQELHWRKGPWTVAYGALRNHIEGKNSGIKSEKSRLGDRKARQARGRVAQTLLAAISIAMENLRRIEKFLQAAREPQKLIADLDGADLPQPYPDSRYPMALAGQMYGTSRGP